MKTDNDYYDFHFFVCTNQKERGGDCASKGSLELFAKLKAWSRTLTPEQTGGRKIRINKSGCLDRCTEGIACVAYPKGEWITDAKLEDLEAIQAWILGRLG